MVDSVSPQSNHSIDDLQLGQLSHNQQIERVNKEASGAQKSGIADAHQDGAVISDEAYAKLAAEKEVNQFVQLIQRTPEAFNNSKVAKFKSLFESGGTNSYLNSISNEELAGDILNSPTGAALR